MTSPRGCLKSSMASSSGWPATATSSASAPTFAATPSWRPSPGSTRNAGRALCGRARPRKHCVKRMRLIGWQSPNLSMPSAHKDQLGSSSHARQTGQRLRPGGRRRREGRSHLRGDHRFGPAGQKTSPGCAKNRPSPESLLAGRRTCGSFRAPPLGSPASRVVRRLSVGAGDDLSLAHGTRAKERQDLRCATVVCCSGTGGTTLGQAQRR